MHNLSLTLLEEIIGHTLGFPCSSFDAATASVQRPSVLFSVSVKFGLFMKLQVFIEVEKHFYSNSD